MYCTIEDIRAEGVTEEQFIDDRVTAAITQAAAYIEKATGRFFYSRELTLTLDGEGDDTLFLDVPIIAVSAITIGGSACDLDDFEIYNRLIPDDRKCPKIVYTEGIFPEGNLNVSISGTFGYLDESGSGEEVERITPPAIKRACIKLVILDLLPLLGDSDAQDDIRRRWLISEKTDGHSYQLSELAMSGGTSGDREIDRILAAYRKPIGVWLI